MPSTGRVQSQPPLPYGAAMPYGAAPSSPSNGLLGTGLAVAGGVAAGMLLDEALHRRTPTGTDQLSGLQHGIFDPPPDDGAASELEHRGIDFGNGSDWDATIGARRRLRRASLVKSRPRARSSTARRPW